ncbi:MAG: thioredoxin family protein [Planctomycetes bacterium]|nr:thioredoxin family protein [Planctomycetota bacterium]
MKRNTVIAILLTLLALFLAAPAARAADAWLTSYDEAVAQSKKTGKPILADFTGSDWCGWCIKLKEEVFSKPEFGKWAAGNVVLLELDFPRKKELPKPLTEQNKKLAAKYGIRGYPTVLFLDEEGEPFGRSGYIEGGPKAWCANADAVLGSRPQIHPQTNYAVAAELAKQKEVPLLLIVEKDDDAKRAAAVSALLRDKHMIGLGGRMVVARVRRKGAGASSAASLKEVDDLLKQHQVKSGDVQIALVDLPKNTLLHSAAKAPAANELVSVLKDKLPQPKYSGEWLDDYQAAVSFAAALGRPLLLDFTGSDWCGWCIKLDKEVFETEEFKKYAKENLVLVKLDFPKKKELPAHLKAQNDGLAEKFAVQGFPTIKVLSSSAQPLGDMGYMEGGPVPFVKRLSEIVASGGKK